MTTIRSKFSFEQFEEVLQKMAHEVALDAVKTLKHGRVRINIYGSRFSHVETDEYGFSFYAKHATFRKSDPDGFAFDVEDKLYLTSNDRSKISFEVWPKEDTEKVQKRIVEFIDKLMTEASIKPVPRFKLSQRGGQRYLDLMNKAGSNPARSTFFGVMKINSLQLWHLRRFCDQHGLDYQLIDLTLTYSECKDYLDSLVPKGIEGLLTEGESQLESYMKHHFLSFYISCALEGETKSEEMGAPIPSRRFSLKEWVKENVSARKT